MLFGELFNWREDGFFGFGAGDWLRANYCAGIDEQQNASKCDWQMSLIRALRLISGQTQLGLWSQRYCKYPLDVRFGGSCERSANVLLVSS